MYKIMFSAHSHQLSILTGFPDYKLVGKLVIFFFYQFFLFSKIH